MANILESNVVTYACACGHLNPITKLFFCRHCLKLRCGFCVCHEVDSHFCSICMENIPSSEAKLKKYRCNKCFECPSCQHTLSARATTIQISKPEPSAAEVDAKANTDPVAAAAASAEAEKAAKLTTRKMYYLSCLACRWTSRDVGLPDQTNATGTWPESEYAFATRFSCLMEYYQNVVLFEKQEKQEYSRRMAPKKHKFSSLTDRTGITASMVRRQMGWSDKLTPKKNPKITASVATDEIDELPATIFTQPVNLKAITTLKQRLRHPSCQPVSVHNLYPQHKPISIKRSLRCKQCEHNVIKPEFNPPSIKYRIQLFASAHMPDVRLIKCPRILFGHPISIQLKLTNPTLQDMTISIMDLPTADEEALIIDDLRASFKNVTVSAVSLPTTPSGSLLSSPLSLSRQASIVVEELRPVSQPVNATLVLPDSSFVLNYRDDTAEFDDEDQIKREDHKFIVWRRSNKVVIQLVVNPHVDSMQAGDEVVVGFTMQYTYVNTVASNVTAGAAGATASSATGEKERHALNARVYVRLGRVQLQESVKAEKNP